MAEPDKTNDVVRFRVGYPDTPKTYDYAAIRTAGGQWYVTGEGSPQGYRWTNLIGWFKSKNMVVHSMRLARVWEVIA